MLQAYLNCPEMSLKDQITGFVVKNVKDVVKGSIFINIYCFAKSNILDIFD